MIRPGQIHWAGLPGAYPHPFVVTAKEPLNRGNGILGAPVTSADFERRSRFPNCVAIRAGQFGLTKDCVIQAENLTRLPLEYLNVDSGPIGELDDETFRALIRAIGVVLDSECEPC